MIYACRFVPSGCVRGRAGVRTCRLASLCACTSLQVLVQFIPHCKGTERMCAYRVHVLGTVTVLLFTILPGSCQATQAK